MHFDTIIRTLNENGREKDIPSVCVRGGGERERGERDRERERENEKATVTVSSVVQNWYFSKLNLEQGKLTCRKEHKINI
jgi:hypothetical protein